MTFFRDRNLNIQSHKKCRCGSELKPDWDGVKDFRYAMNNIPYDMCLLYCTDCINKEVDGHKLATMKKRLIE